MCWRTHKIFIIIDEITFSLLHSSIYLIFLFYSSILTTSWVYINIMNFNDFFIKQQPVFILTHKNYDQWFSLMKKWLIEKDLWFIIEDKSDLNTLDSIIDIISEIQSLDFESQKIDVKAHYWLIICIIINDQEHTADKTSAKEIWNTLSYKYKEKLQIIEKQYLMNFIDYRMLMNISIEKTWTHLVKLTWKIIITQNDISNLFKSERRFQVLLKLLSDEYMIIWDVIDAQNKSNVERELQKLQEKKAQLKTIKIAL